MPVTPIEINGAAVDLSRRFLQSSTVVGSPAAAAETVVASITVNDSFAVTQGTFIEAAVAFTVGTSGTAVTLKIRQTGTSGTTIYTTGALTATAANLMNVGLQGFDAAANVTLPGQVYVVTLTVASGAATSTVSSVSMFASVI